MDTIPEIENFESVDVISTELQLEHWRDTERSLLGACLRGGIKTYEQAREIVQLDHFYIHPFSWAWEAMESLYQQSMGIDVLTVADELTRMNKMEEFRSGQWSGRALLSSLRSEGEPANVMTYAENVQDLYVKRKLDRFFGKCMYWSQNGRRAKDILEDVERSLSQIALYSSQDEYTVPISTAVSEAYDWTDKAARGDIAGVKTGFVDLDKILGSMIAGNVYIVAGRPGEGKTGLLISIARHAAKTQNKRVGMFSLEMSRHQVALRLIAQEENLNLQNLILGKLEDDEWPRYTYAVEKVAQFPIVINDLSSINIAQIRSISRKIKAAGGLDLIVLDYIQLASGDQKRYERRDLEVSAISRGLKYLARELDVPILAAAQLSRAVEQRAGKRPILSDLRESGSLEQDAYCVMFIYKSEENVKQNITEIVVAKHRNGPVGACELVFRSSVAGFENAYTKQVNL